jgi:hypothetical protein
MRRRLALLAALGLVLSLPAAVSAGKSTHATDTQVSIDCEGIATTGGSGFAFFNAFTSTSGDFDTDFAFWSASEPVDQPDVSRDFDAPADVTWDGTTLSGSFAIVDSTGDPVGSAAFSATLTPVGDPAPFTDSFKDGNHKFSATGTDQPMQPEGTLTTTTGLTFDLADCLGDLTVVTIFATNPASAVSHFAQRTSDCPLTSTTGDDGFVFIDFTESDGAFVDSAVFAPGGGGVGATSFGPIVGGVLDLNLDTYDFDTGEGLSIPASIHATFTETNDRFVVDMHSRADRRITRGTLVDIEGTLTIGSVVFDLSPCVGANARTKDMFVPMQGPKAGGKVPTNDKPAGAIQLARGKSATVMTKGASVDREAPYECLTFEDEGGPFEVPVANTVWYKVTGTGGPITIDTAGSDFDTVLQVYTASGGGFQFVPDGCVDDVPLTPFGRSLQAAVTIPTVAGTTYYVQIGGFPDTAFPYGNLKVAVR